MSNRKIETLIMLDQIACIWSCAPELTTLLSRGTQLQSLANWIKLNL